MNDVTHPILCKAALTVLTVSSSELSGRWNPSSLSLLAVSWSLFRFNPIGGNLTGHRACFAAVNLEVKCAQDSASKNWLVYRPDLHVFDVSSGR